MRGVRVGLTKVLDNKRHSFGPGMNPILTRHMLLHRGVQLLDQILNGIAYSFSVFSPRTYLHALPSGQGAWVNTKLAGELILPDAQDSTQLDDSFSEVVAAIRERHVPKKLNDLRNKVKAW